MGKAALYQQQPKFVERTAIKKVDLLVEQDLSILVRNSACQVSSAAQPFVLW